MVENHEGIEIGMAASDPQVAQNDVGLFARMSGCGARRGRPDLATGGSGGKTSPLVGQAPKCVLTRLTNRRGSKSPTATKTVFSGTK